MMNNKQLADILRPQSFDEIVGQDHLFGEKGIIRKMLASGRLTNMVFYGPPGTGKTTAASIIAKESGMQFYKLNATSATLNDVKNILAESSSVFGMNGILLYLDEIQYFNRKQQQSLLEYIEDGRITLITSTTENPHFYIYNAILSRSSLFEFKRVGADDLKPVFLRALKYLNETCNTEKTISEEVMSYIGKAAKGDARHSIILFENAFYSADKEITIEDVASFDTNITNFNDDTHYDLMSCLQKSIRGSDPDAAVFYLAKLLACGELLAACRRLQVIASEDIGLAYPIAAAVTRACCESAVELGLPEAQIPLANATIMLANAPKSNSACVAVETAMKDAQAGKGQEIPLILQAPLFKGYKYPHSYQNHYVEQEYIPLDLKGKKYYVPGENKNEKATEEYWKNIKKK